MANRWLHKNREGEEDGGGGEGKREAGRGVGRENVGAGGGGGGGREEGRKRSPAISLMARPVGQAIESATLVVAQTGIREVGELINSTVVLRVTPRFKWEGGDRVVLT